MKVSYPYDEAALLAFNEYATKHSPSFRRTTALGRLTMPLALGAYILLTWLEGDALLCPTLTAIAVSVLWFALYPTVQSHLGTRFVKQVVQEGSNRGVFEEYTLEITPEYVYRVSSGSEVKYAWHRIQKVESTSDYLFIYYTSLSAIVVPCVSLAGASFDELRNQVVEYHNASVASQHNGSRL